MDTEEVWTIEKKPHVLHWCSIKTQQMSGSQKSGGSYYRLQGIKMKNCFKDLHLRREPGGIESTKSWCSQISSRESSNVKHTGFLFKGRRCVPGFCLDSWEWMLLTAWWSVLSTDITESGHTWIPQTITFVYPRLFSALYLYLEHAFSVNKTHPYERCHMYFTKAYVISVLSVGPGHSWLPQTTVVCLSHSP